MIIKFIKILISFKFDLPKKNNLLLYDEIHSDAFKKIINKNFNTLEIRKKKIYFWIYLKQIIFLDFTFKTYCKNYIKFTSPKVIITFNEARFDMYELKNSFEDVSFNDGVWLPGVNNETLIPDGSVRVYGTWTGKSVDSGKEFSIDTYHWFEVENGKISKSGDYFDATGMVMATQADPIEEDAEE